MAYDRTGRAELLLACGGLFTFPSVDTLLPLVIIVGEENTASFRLSGFERNL